jgi:hypothetical protein
MPVRTGMTKMTPGLPETTGAAAVTARDKCDKGERPTITRTTRNGTRKWRGKDDEVKQGHNEAGKQQKPQP